jgi:hypothetical protein
MGSEKQSTTIKACADQKLYPEAAPPYRVAASAAARRQHSALCPGHARCWHSREQQLASIIPAVYVLQSDAN